MISTTCTETDISPIQQQLMDYGIDMSWKGPKILSC